VFKVFKTEAQRCTVIYQSRSCPVQSTSYIYIEHSPIQSSQDRSSRCRDELHAATVPRPQSSPVTLRGRGLPQPGPGPIQPSQCLCPTMPSEDLLHRLRRRHNEFCQVTPRSTRHTLVHDDTRYAFSESCRPTQRRITNRQHWIRALHAKLTGHPGRGLATVPQRQALLLADAATTTTHHPYVDRVLKLIQATRTLQLAVHYLTSQRVMQQFSSPDLALDAFATEHELRVPQQLRVMIFRTTLDALQRH